MADQIILEFIGDPSGLKPAEEALKGLNKTTHDTIEAFNKANEAAKKFAETTGHMSTSVKNVGEATKKSVTSISSLNKTISAGAVKTFITDLKNWAGSVSELTGQKDKLRAKLATVKTEMAAVKEEVTKAEKEYKSLNKESKSLEGQINSTGKAFDSQSKQAAKAADKSADLKNKLEEAEKKLAAVDTTTKKGSASFESLSKKVAKLKDDITKSNTSYTEHTTKAQELSKKQEELKGKLGGVESQMVKTNKTIVDGKTKQGELGAEAKKLEDSIGKTTKSISHANKEYSNHSKAAKDSTKSVTALINNTKKLVTSMSNIAEAMAHATGNEKEAAAIHEKTNQVLNILTATQDIASTATKTMSTATDTASAASKAFGSAAKGAWAEATLGIVPVIEGIITLIQNFDEIKKKVLALFPALKALFGIKEIEDHTAALVKNGDQQDKLKKSLDDKIARMKDEGATEKEILEEQKRQVDIAIKLNAEAVLKLKAEIQSLALHGQIKASMFEELAVLEKQGKTLSDQSKEYSKSLDEENKKDKERKQENYKEALQYKVELKEKELQLTKEGTKERMDAEIALIKAQAALETVEKGKTAKMVELIEKEKLQKIAEVTSAFRIKNIEEEKKEIDAKLQSAAKGSQEEYDLKMQLLAKEREIVSVNVKLSEEQRKKAFDDINKEEDKSYADRAKQIADEKKALEDAEKQELEDTIKTNQEKLTSDKLTSAEKLAATKAVLNAQEKLEIDAVMKSGKQEVEIVKAITDIKAQYHQQQSKAEKDAAISDALQVSNTEIAGINNTIEALKAKGGKALDIAKKELQIIETQKSQNKDLLKKELITAAEFALRELDLTKQSEKKKTQIKKEEAKEAEETAKKYAAKAIEMAKEVSNAIFDNAKQKRDNELKEKLDHLEEQKSAELLNTTLTTSQKAAIEKKYKIQEAQEKEKAWKADQKAKGEQAIINGLLAFTAALASSPPPMNYINAAIALASAGVQAGIIFAKTPPKFATGVVGLQGPGTETSDSIPAYLSKGESVITARATKKYAPMLEAMNAGTFHDYMPIPHIPDVSSQLAAALKPIHTDTNHPIDYDKLSEAFARRINMKQLHVNIDEKGFTKSILSKNSRIESYNDKMKF